MAELSRSCWVAPVGFLKLGAGPTFLATLSYTALLPLSWGCNGRDDEEVLFEEG